MSAPSIHPLALSRKSAQFARSDESDDIWMVIATLIKNCKLTASTRTHG